jgi:hypothetical protein
MGFIIRYEKESHQSYKNYYQIRGGGIRRSVVTNDHSPKRTNKMLYGFPLDHPSCQIQCLQGWSHP